MSRTQNDPQYEERRQEIVDAAERCIIRNGIHQLKLRDIAKEYGKSLGNIYNYFQNKEAIIEVLVARATDRFIKVATAKIDPALKEKLSFEEKLRLRMKKIVDAYMDPEGARIAISIYSEAVVNPKVREMTVEANKRLRAHIMGLCTQGHDLTPEEEARLAAEITMTHAMLESLRGAILFNPALDKEVFRSVVIDRTTKIILSEMLPRANKLQ